MSRPPDVWTMRWVLAAVMVVAAAGAWRRRRRHERQRRLMLLCDAAGLRFAAVDPFPGTAWLPFEMFGRTPSGTSNVVWDPRREGGVRAFDFWYEDARADHPVASRRTITCAAVPLGFTCPRVRVAPRDLVDDVSDALGFPLVTLELEEFNRRFRVEAEDARAASALLDQRVMHGLLRLPPGVVVEVNEEVLLLWAPELPAVEMLGLLQAATSIQRDLPRVMTSLFPPRPVRGAHERRWLQGGWSPEPTGADRVDPSGSAGRPAR